MNEQLSILLHAAARGARIEYDYNAGAKSWHPAGVVGLKEPWCVGQRIHPDDILLRFGPISRALYEAAKNPPVFLDDAYGRHFGMEVYAQENDYQRYDYADNETRQWFLLMLAESLCHSGL